MELKGKKVAIVGLGPRTAPPLIRFLLAKGARIFISEAQETTPLQPYLDELGPCVEVELGGHSSRLLENRDLIVVSPGVPADQPLLVQARRRGVPVWAEMELAFRFSKAPWLAITGTNGKTTVTLLTGMFLKTMTRPVLVAGNIGTPLIDKVSELDNDAWVVVEASSFQLEQTEKLKPRIACILNITPEHLDRHKTMAAYIKAKTKIFRNQDAADYLLLNADNAITAELARDRITSQVVLFSSAQAVQGFYIKDGWIYNGLDDEYLFPANLTRLPGRHNLENVLAAAALARLAGTSPKAMAEVTKRFTTISHTLEVVAVINGVTYINDSQGTNPEATISGLQAVKGRKILIAGGQERGLDLQKLAQAILRFNVKALVLMGENRERLQREVITEGLRDIYLVKDMREAVKVAGELAEAGDTVLMSPAAPSWDQYQNYAERGERFRFLVRNMGGQGDA